MEEEKFVNKKIKEFNDNNIFNPKIPSFLNDPKKAIINQRNFEDDKFSQIEQAYEISQNNYNNDFDLKENLFNDIIDKIDKIPNILENDKKFFSLKSTNESDLFNPIFNNNDSFDLNIINNKSLSFDDKSNNFDINSLINDDIFNKKNIHKYNNSESNNNSYLSNNKRKRSDIENSKESFLSDLEFCHSESYNNDDPFILQFDFKKKKVDANNKSPTNKELKNNIALEKDNNLLNLFGLKTNSSKLLQNLQDKPTSNKINIIINNKINISINNTNNMNLNININSSDKSILNIFNYDNYKHIYYDLLKDYKFEEPPFIDLKKIINDPNNKSMIENLGKEIGIDFKNEKDLAEIEKGLIFQNLSNFLNKIKNEYKDNIIYKHQIRKFMIDEMSNKLKTFLLKVIIEHINSFGEMGNNEIKVLNLDKINNKIKCDFNFVYFHQYTYSILANETKSKKYKNNNYEIIENKLKTYNEKGDYSELIEHLHFTVKDYLDMIRHIKSDKTNELNEKLEQYLINEYKHFEDVKKKGKGLDYFINLLREKNLFNSKQKNENEIKDCIKKDYICSLLLLTYNLERFFFLRISRGFKKPKKI